MTGGEKREIGTWPITIRAAAVRYSAGPRQIDLVKLLNRYPRAHFYVVLLQGLGSSTPPIMCKTKATA